MTLDYIRSKNFKGIILDSNLLLLLLIGHFNIDEVERNKRLQNKAFEKEDFYRLISLIEAVSNNIVITPNILTEVSNLSEKYNEETNFAFFKFLEMIIKPIEERNSKSKDIILNNQTAFYKFGLADSSITNLSKENYLIVTVDFPLYHFLSSQNLPAINYNHLRVA